jgi:hypothetical protein
MVCAIGATDFNESRMLELQHELAITDRLRTRFIQGPIRKFLEGKVSALVREANSARRAGMTTDSEFGWRSTEVIAEHSLCLFGFDGLENISRAETNLGES